MSTLVQRQGPEQLTVEAEGLSQAGPDVVWRLVGDVRTYSRWGPWTATGYSDRGQSGPDQPGTVRWLRYRRTTTVERVLEVEPGRRMTYTVVRGNPVRHYVAEVTLTPDGTGTRVRWTATWDRTLGGRLVHRTLVRLYPEMVAALVAGADSAALAGPGPSAA